MQKLSCHWTLLICLIISSISSKSKGASKYLRQVWWDSRCSAFRGKIPLQLWMYEASQTSCLIPKCNGGGQYSPDISTSKGRNWGVPLWLIGLRTWLVSMRMWIQFLASLSGLRTGCCHKLQHRSQMWLRSGVAVAVLGWQLQLQFNP